MSSCVSHRTFRRITRYRLRIEQRVTRRRCCLVRKLGKSLRSSAPCRKLWLCCPRPVDRPAKQQGDFMTQPGAGWYPDPSDPSRQRYFDGTAWTESYAPLPAPPAGVSQPAKPGKHWNWKWIAGVGAVAVVLIAIGSTGGNDKKTVAESNTAASVPSTGSATAPAKPSKPAGTVVAPAGSAVRDGKFEFKVLGVSVGHEGRDLQPAAGQRRVFRRQRPRDEHR